MKLNNIILFVIIIGSIISCKQTKNSPAYKAFLTQEHRFVLNECELTYNEKPFYIGMPLEEARALFGEESNTYRGGMSVYKNKTTFFWKKKGLRLSVFDNIVKYIYKR